MASLIPPHLQMEAQREEGRVALHLQSFVKGAWVGGRAGWPRPGAEALALWQVKGAKGQTRVERSSNHFRMVVLLSYNWGICE